MPPLCDLNFGPLACFMSVSKAGAAGGARAKAEHHEVLFVDKHNRLKVNCPLTGHEPPRAAAVPRQGADSKLSLPDPAKLPAVAEAKAAAPPPFAASPGGLDLPAGREAKLGAAPDRARENSPARLELPLAPQVIPVVDIGRGVTPVGSESRPAGAPKCPLLTALDAGRWMEARRLLHEAQGAGRAPLSDGMVERIKRICTRYVESQAELAASKDDGWTSERDDEQGIDFAFKLSDRAFQVVSSKVYEGFDAFQAFVGLCEYDLSREYCAQVQSAELLPGDCMTSDGIWRVHQEAHGGRREDNIVQVSCLDALDEQLGALWVSAYVPEGEGLTELRGVPLPRPADGSVRTSYWRSVYAITPLFPQGPSAKPCFRMTVGLCRRPSSAAFTFPSVQRREAVSVLKDFQKFLETCTDLNWRALFSKRAPFYELVRRHLAEKTPPRSLAPRSPMVQLTFAELSVHLPEDWADAYDEV